MLKTSNTKSIKPRKGGVKIVGDGKFIHGGKTELNSRDKLCRSKVDRSKIRENEVVKEKNY